MEKNLRLTFRRGDVIAVLLVLLTAAAVMAAFATRGDSDGNTAAYVYQDGKLLREVMLDTEGHMEINGEYTNIITVENGRICISESDCPGADCVHSGWISSPGRSIVCLPNRVEIRIEGASDVDFAVG